MATTPYQIDPTRVVRISERLWSEEVQIADATEPPTPDVAYEFGDGRRFVRPTNPYEEPQS